MAKASKKHFGVGTQGVGAGTGAMTDLQKDMVNENEILSNRDKAGHPRERGLDGKEVQNEQRQDHAANRQHENPHSKEQGE